MTTVCKICGITFEPQHYSTLCQDCEKERTKEGRETQRIVEKAKARAKNNKLDTFCDEANKQGLSYAQLQVRETIERERRLRKK